MSLFDALDAFGKAPSQSTFGACQDQLRNAKLFIGVKQAASGRGFHVGIDTRPDGASFLPAFLDESAALGWWKGVEGITAQAVAGPSLIETAAGEQADFLVLEPQDENRNLPISRQQYEQLATIWKTRWLPRQM